MNKFIFALVLLACGFVAGWYARNFFTDPKELLQNNSEFNSNPSSERSQVDGDNNSSETDASKIPDITAIELIPRDVEADSGGQLETFRTLLNKRQFTAAVNFFREVEYRNYEAAKELKEILINQLQNYLAKKHRQFFIELVNAYLASYYNDTDILLLVADFNAQYDYFSEALATYQLVISYSQGKADRQLAIEKLNSFIESTDTKYIASGSMYEAQLFYELLDQYGLAAPMHRFRLAEIYAANDYEDLSEVIFRDLVADPLLGKKAELRLEAMAEDRMPKVAVVSDMEEIPLTVIGEHYLVEVYVDTKQTINLLIDTGASTTLISRGAFDNFEDFNSFTQLPSRMFSTVNGVTRGDVYIVPQLQLGQSVLHDIEIAVIDFYPGQGVDGLLGMNILRKFKFQINQDQQTLGLAKRESPH